MIKWWQLFNFKSVREDTTLFFAPLTLFGGSNSSGKSTVIQSILMLSQTLASKVPSRSVVLNGHIVRLGAFDDLRSFNSQTDHILVGAGIEPLTDPSQMLRYRSPSELPRRQFIVPPRRAGRLKDISFAMSFDIDPAASERELLQLQPRLRASHVAATFLDQDGDEEHTTIEITRSQESPATRAHALGLATPFSQLPSEWLEYNIAIDRPSLEALREDTPTYLPIGCSLRHFLPSYFVVRVDAKDESARSLANALTDPRPLSRYSSRQTPIPPEVMQLLAERLGDKFPRPLRDRPLFGAPEVELLTVQDWANIVQRLPYSERTSLRAPLRELSSEIVQKMTSGPPRYEARGVRPPLATVEVVDYLEHFFASSVKYLGPLREEPKPLYPLVGSADPSDVGMKGEYTTAVLDLYKNTPVEYIPSSRFVQGQLTPGQTIAPLRLAVLDWLQYMGVVHELTTRDRGKLGHELKVKISGTDIPHDITHVGVGVSQVLPIVVMCLLAERDTVLILEQPELHLHPRVQTRLADFFLAMGMSGKQCIVETHSEYLMTRLRLRIAAAPEDSLTSLVRMYYVERIEGASVYRPVAVNRYGAIPDWPEGFFDESQKEAEDIIRAALSKRREERGTTDGT